MNRLPVHRSIRLFMYVQAAEQGLVQTDVGGLRACEDDRIWFEDGQPFGVEGFHHRFSGERRTLGRHAGWIVLVGDDANGVMYRVGHSVAAGAAPNKE